MTLNNKVITFGCRLNIFESQIIKDNIKIAGINNSIIINTCAVTNEAERQARQAIRKERANNPNAKIIVTGCSAQLNPEIYANMVEVDQVFGNNEKLHLGNYKKEEKILVNDIMAVKDQSYFLATNFFRRTRAFLEIQNGCNHRCTFCTVPYARGNSRSVPIGLIVDNITSIIKHGYKEIVFTGVDITDYGKDLPGSPSLGQMIKRVLNLVPELKRLRLSSIDVAEIDNNLLDLFKTESRLMPHIHLSLQSGDNLILKRMKRRHNREQVLDFCHTIRNHNKDVAFGADIIAGFPTEKEEAFINTVDLIKKADIQYLHVFPYSARKNTPASRMPQVTHLDKKKRAKFLRDLKKSQIKKFLLKNLGNVKNVLLEKDNYGHSDNFIEVFLENKDIKGNIVAVEFIDINNKNEMKGRILQ